MKTINIVYWSGTGNTQAMAEFMADAIKENGHTANVYDVGDISPEDTAKADGILLGCPSMGMEVLEETVFEPFVEAFTGLSVSQPVGIFGSYDWGDGEWMRNWAERMEDAGIKVVGDGLIEQLEPSKEPCADYAKALIEQL